MLTKAAAAALSAECFCLAVLAIGTTAAALTHLLDVAVTAQPFAIAQLAKPLLETVRAERTAAAVFAVVSAQNITKTH